MFFDAAAFFDWFVNNASYLMVFVFMTIESSFIPFPSEVVVPPAAYIAASTGRMDVTLVCLAATVGALVGSLINYFLALWIGRPLVYAFARSRFGHACLIDEEKVQRAEAYFDKHGAISTLIGRLIPVVRQLISIPAGLARMNLLTFCIFTTIGAAIWNVVLTALGWWLAKTVSINTLRPKVEEYNTYLTYIGLGIGVLAILFILWNAFKPQKK